MIFSHNNAALNIDLKISIDFNNFSGEFEHKLLSPIEFVNKSTNPVIKFLGVQFDPQLTFKNPISLISSKISKGLFVLRSAKNILSPKALKALYYSLIHSHLVYCIQIWSCGNQNAVNGLFIKQKAAIRIINKKHTMPILRASSNHHLSFPYPH
jgi:hypothetical protein